MTADVTPALLASRRASSASRLTAFTEAITDKPELHDPDSFCVYVTGSYGRLEASDHSDLDLFFVQDASPASASPIDTVQHSLLNATLIRVARDLDFPEFSGGGEYLEFHELNDILQSLGSPDDDYENYFTARLLLLLESRPVLHESIYQQAIEAIVGAYYRDYHDHEKAFLPVFLANDIIRFWKTLCLNYEHRRNRQIEDPTPEGEDPSQEPKAEVQPVAYVLFRNPLVVR